MGSTIVLIFEGPKNGKLLLEEGKKVTLGEDLFVLSDDKDKKE